MVRYAVRLPRSRRIRTALGVAAGFVVVSGAVLSSQAPHTDTPVVASGALGRSVTGPGPAAVAANGIFPRSYAHPASAQTVVEALPATGAPGLRVVATPYGRTLQMSEVATFTTAQRSVVLTPPSLLRAGAQFDRLHPVVGEVTVYLDGEFFMVVHNLEKARTVVFPKGAHQVRLTYLLSGVFSSTAPGKSDGVTALEPLLSSLHEPLPVSYKVGGNAITASIVCPELPIFNQGCGRSAGVLSGLPSDQSLVVITLGPPTLTLDPIPGVTQPTGGGSAASTPPPSSPSIPPPAPDPVAPATTPPTTPPTLPTDPASPQPPPLPSASPPPSDTPTPTSTPEPAPSTTPAPPIPTPTDPLPTTDPPTSAPPPPTDPPTVAPTTTPPIGTEKMPNVAQGAPIGTELRMQPTSPATPTATVTPEPTATSSVSPTSTVGP